MDLSPMEMSEEFETLDYGSLGKRELVTITDAAHAILEATKHRPEVSDMPVGGSEPRLDGSRIVDRLSIDGDVVELTRDVLKADGALGRSTRMRALDNSLQVSHEDTWVEIVPNDDPDTYALLSYASKSFFDVSMELGSGR